jgi:hypothetical protein
MEHEEKVETEQQGPPRPTITLSVGIWYIRENQLQIPADAILQGQSVV